MWPRDLVSYITHVQLYLYTDTLWKEMNGLSSYCHKFTATCINVDKANVIDHSLESTTAASGAVITSVKSSQSGRGRTDESRGMQQRTLRYHPLPVVA